MPIKNNQVLILDNVCKRFGGVVAADEVSFALASGQVRGLIGPNGSGKTTVLNIISGICEADPGSVIFDGVNITKRPSHVRARMGIARTFQHPRLLKRCDIRTNLFLGVDLANMKEKSSLFSKKANQSLEEILETAGLKISMGDSISSLSYGQQKLFEIVRAILTNPKVVLLDEPAAGLNTKEMERVKELIDIAVRNNAAVLLVEHSMDLVMNLCNIITVLNFGRTIAEGIPEKIQSNEAVIEAYLGKGRHA
ncbi:MAG TPA: ABC transporter ATP-binding protein [Nitrospirota bacterium]|nr:ABC transporter ATP-binding protein [Nitrospirota bacterium]